MPPAKAPQRRDPRLRRGRAAAVATCGARPRRARRAVTMFGKLRVWDTEHNNGVLIYLLLAEHAIEIVADRGLNRRVPAERMAGHRGAAWRAAFRRPGTSRGRPRRRPSMRSTRLLGGISRWPKARPTLTNCPTRPSSAELHALDPLQRPRGNARASTAEAAAENRPGARAPRSRAPGRAGGGSASGGRAAGR